MSREQKQHLLVAISWVVGWWIITQQIAARIGVYCMERAAAEWKLAKGVPSPGVIIPPPPTDWAPDGRVAVTNGVVDTVDPDVIDALSKRVAAVEGVPEGTPDEN